jgi:hypothetical protein
LKEHVAGSHACQKVIPSRRLQGSCNSMVPDPVIPPDENFDGNIKVIQPQEQSSLEVRVEAVEKQLSLLQESASKESENFSGPDEIRTHDPRRVKAMS